MIWPRLCLSYSRARARSLPSVTFSRRLPGKARLVKRSDFNVPDPIRGVCCRLGEHCVHTAAISSRARTGRGS
jgi:hypothetical protein